jgi:cobalt-zinc-cadmium efflux system outer membrane protein
VSRVFPAHYGLRAIGALFIGAALPTLAISQAATDSSVLRLTLAEARALVLRQNPELLAARQAPAVAEGELRQARTIRFNPDLNVIARGSPELALTQEVEWAGQRGLRSAAAQSGLSRAVFETADVERQLIGDVTMAYYRAVAASARRDVVDQLAVLTDRLITAVRIQLKEGEISVLEANLAEIENGRVRGRALEARRAVAAAEFELKQVLGAPPNTALRLVHDTAAAAVTVPSLEDSLVAAALRQRPDLRATAAGVDEARTRVALTRKEALPSIRVGGVLEPGTSGAGFGLAVGLSLPVLNRNRGAAEARAAEARRVELLHLALESRVRSEVSAAIASYRAATEELRLYAETVLQPARTSAVMLDEAYRAGKIALPSLLLLRNQLLDAEFGYWDAWLTRHEAVARLNTATGAFPPSTPFSAEAPSSRQEP